MVKATISISQKWIWSEAGFCADFPWHKEQSEAHLVEQLESALSSLWLEPHVVLSEIDKIGLDKTDTTGELTTLIEHEMINVWQEFDWLVRK